MDGADIGIGLLLFPQMYEQMRQKKDGNDDKVVAICPHCGTINEHPYKFCKECGKRPEVLREPGVSSVFRLCPYCGTELNLPKQPRFCPYCTERLN